MDVNVIKFSVAGAPACLSCTPGTYADSTGLQHRHHGSDLSKLELVCAYKESKRQNYLGAV
jgi:hypothetical protein